MKPFSAKERKIVFLTLLFIVAISLKNFQVAIRRGRDSDRKISLGEVHTALDYYQNDFGFYPPSSADGKIVACAKPGVDYKDLKLSGSPKTRQESLLEIFAPCEWGKDGLYDISDPDYPAYIKTFPLDPQDSEGALFFYSSDTKNFQLLGSLESSGEDEYEEGIVKRALSCGSRVCNFGKSNGGVPLDKSLKEYENEYRQDD